MNDVDVAVLGGRSVQRLTRLPRKSSSRLSHCPSAKSVESLQHYLIIIFQWSFSRLHFCTPCSSRLLRNHNKICISSVNNECIFVHSLICFGVLERRLNISHHNSCTAGRAPTSVTLFSAQLDLSSGRICHRIYQKSYGRFKHSLRMRSYVTLVCRLMVSIPVIHVMTWIITHLPTPERRKAELAWLFDLWWTLPTKWSHVIRSSGIVQGKSASQRPTS